MSSEPFPYEIDNRFQVVNPYPKDSVSAHLYEHARAREPIYRANRYYIVSTRKENGGAKPRNPKYKRHTSRVKSRKRARCRAKRRRA